METIDAIADALGVTPAELFALGEGHRASPPAEVAEVVDTLLSTWSAKDQVRLVGILRELHAVGWTAAVAQAPGPAHGQPEGSA